MNKTIATSSIGLSSELPFELIAHDKSIRYQQWIMDAIKPYLGRRILELGAGIGNMSRWLIDAADFIMLTEQDPQLLSLLRSRLPEFPTKQIDIATHTLAEFQEDSIDTIVSFNVLEHIEDDGFVLHNCAQLLRNNPTPGKKRIITFVPAHQWAYGVMDKSVGHFRRYDRDRFIQLHKQVTPDAKLILLPFNFVGLWGWAVNGRILRRHVAGSNVLQVFEKLCPLLRLMDKIIIHKFKIPLGQSLLAIQEWE